MHLGRPIWWLRTGKDNLKWRKHVWKSNLCRALVCGNRTNWRWEAGRKLQKATIESAGKEVRRAASRTTEWNDGQWRARLKLKAREWRTWTSFDGFWVLRIIFLCFADKCLQMSTRVPHSPPACSAPSLLRNGKSVARAVYKTVSPWQQEENWKWPLEPFHPYPRC